MNTDGTGRRGIHLVASKFEEIGFAFRELPTSDYGIDAEVELRAQDAVTGRLIAVQIKGGPSYFRERSSTAVVYRPSRDHVTYWMGHSLPVFIVLADLEEREAYWQVVSPGTLIETGKHFRIDVPTQQKVDSASISAIASYCAPSAAATAFSIASESDVSHARARRISQDILVHPTGQGTTQATLSTIIQQSVTSAIGSDYLRSAAAESEDMARPVHMVNGFVYLRDIDRSTASWSARYQWTSDDIDPSARYKALQGEELSPGLYVEWRLENEIAAMLDEHRVGKGAYLQAVREPLASAQKIHGRLKGQGVDGRPTLPLSDGVIEAIAEMASDLDDRPMPPPECARLDQAVGCLGALLGNVGIIARDGGPYAPPTAERVFRSTIDEMAEQLLTIRVCLKDVS